MKKMKYMVLILLLILNFISYAMAEDETYMRKFYVVTDIGLGNMISLYEAYGLSKNHYFGIGCGYLYYQDPETDVSINAIEPSLIWFTTLGDTFIIRARAGIDLVGRKGEGLKKTAYMIAPDFLVNVINYRQSSIYAGVSLPFIIGDESVEMDTVIGMGYAFYFNVGVVVKSEEEVSIQKLIEKSSEEKRKKVEGLYFEGLDLYYRGDVKNAIKQWENIDITDKELMEKIKKQVKKAKKELKEKKEE
ncbi:MAG: hypothetical protein JW827_01760 [Spirochaetes bacterium]|nr:hypothetical protein [Spirochaetota bacterium]